MSKPKAKPKPRLKKYSKSKPVQELNTPYMTESRNIKDGHRKTVCHGGRHGASRYLGADAVNRQIIKSLTWIIAVVSGGWFATVTCVTVVNYFLKLSPTQTPASFAYIGIFVNIGCASNFFILYKCR